MTGWIACTLLIAIPAWLLALYINHHQDGDNQ